MKDELGDRKKGIRVWCEISASLYNPSAPKTFCTKAHESRLLQSRKCPQ
jgi:hypothetical protein